MNFEKNKQPKTCRELLREFRERKEIKRKGEQIKFEGVEEGKDVYNITAPFEIEDTNYILGRVESAIGARDASVIWFKQKTDKLWVADKTMPVLPGEDPAIVRIKDKEEGDQIVVSMVKVLWRGDKFTNYKTSFYKGKNLSELKQVFENDRPFAEGPDIMRDIRLVSLPNGKIGIFSRPETKQGRKEIGFIEINSLKELGAKKINQAKIIENLFAPGSAYGGVNQIHILDEEHLGLLGHIAYLDKQQIDNEPIRHYYSTAFTFNFSTHQASPLKIIAERADFPSGQAKRPDLQDVIFSVGLKREKNGTAVLYAGLSDKEAGRRRIKDPFLS